ncbi:hypothetical protein IEQ34_015850 [Dendrobium chrysotoxum]|uniref:Uncharacterized protein n=1 Tax=Dendrobium chrysotoxum TaxID=161865 RepID=A0AAV7GJE1_DENCH|nr:hypothetical protein IEQ34_015850 [Dendrobium chrysotoxum]
MSQFHLKQRRKGMPRSSERMRKNLNENLTLNRTQWRKRIHQYLTVLRYGQSCLSFERKIERWILQSNEQVEDRENAFERKKKKKLEKEVEEKYEKVKMLYFIKHSCDDLKKENKTSVLLKNCDMINTLENVILKMIYAPDADINHECLSEEEPRSTAVIVPRYLNLLFVIFIYLCIFRFYPHLNE